MGKGDKKTPKGKRFASSHGNARPSGIKKISVKKTAAVVKAPAVKKAAPRKKAS